MSDNKPPSEMTGQEMFDRGMEIRRKVLGDEYVDKALAKSGPFNEPLQELVTTYCWGWNWGREGLPLRDRSLINLAMIAVLGRENELKIHIRGALNNGLSKDEIREVLLQVGIYAGIPAAVDSFRIANEAFAQIDAEKSDDS
ncbi:carboxymuconolactone decarboxylase family protein [Alteraurantiacibacter aquimixticola]|nr:carboxymuconolactone decarboxylase family protein [Alteraurantiacibacter aquimixticola]